MSNRLNICVCEFKDVVNRDLHVVESYYGFRIYDDYATAYNNYFDSIEEVYESIDNDLKKLIRDCESFEDIDFENLNVYVGNEIISFDENGNQIRGTK